MNTRIKRLFAANRPARVLFASCGFPTLEKSERVIETMIEKGADIIELGVPFSDPVADGPEIQTASQQAIANGSTLSGIIDMAARIRRRHPETGLILFSYFNPLLNAGLESLCDRLADAGIDGIICLDLPFEESGELKPLCDARGLHLIPIVSPETDEARIPIVTAGCKGFVYAIGGLTGERLALIRRLSALPVVTAEAVIGGEPDGRVIASAALCPLLENTSFEAGLAALADYLESLFKQMT